MALTFAEVEKMDGEDRFHTYGVAYHQSPQN